MAYISPYNHRCNERTIEYNVRTERGIEHHCTTCKRVWWQKTTGHDNAGRPRFWYFSFPMVKRRP